MPPYQYILSSDDTGWTKVGKVLQIVGNFGFDVEPSVLW
jgi:hypothetical protein